MSVSGPESLMLRSSYVRSSELPSSRWDFIRLFTVCFPQVETWGYLLLSLRDPLRIPAGSHCPKPKLPARSSGCSRIIDFR